MLKTIRRLFKKHYREHNNQSKILCKHVIGSDRNFTAFVENRSDLKFEDGSRIILKSGSKLMVNVTDFDHKLVAPALLFLSTNSTLIIDGEFTMYEGAQLYLGPGATLEVHGKSFINKSCIDCSNHIVIGDDVAIASEVLIQDSDYHQIIANRSELEDSSIHIGNHVWICARVTILKGVSIGDGAVIAAGSLVNMDVPKASLVGGIPAKVLRSQIEWKG